MQTKILKNWNQILYLSSSEHIELQTPIAVHPCKTINLDDRLILEVKLLNPLSRNILLYKHRINYEIINKLYLVSREDDKKFVNMSLPHSVHVTLLINENKDVDWNNLYHWAWATLYDNYEDAKNHTWG